MIPCEKIPSNFRDLPAKFLVLTIFLLIVSLLIALKRSL